MDEREKDIMTAEQPEAPEMTDIPETAEPVATAESSEVRETPAATEKPAEAPRPLKKTWWFYAVLVGIVLVCASTWFRFVQVIGPGGVYWRSSTELDLRAEVMSVADYEKLQQKLPDCAIRWNIPIGDKTFDSQSTSIRLGHLSMEDIEHFALFDRLENVDGNGCTDYEALLALYETHPEWDIRWGITFGTAKYANGSYALRLSMDKYSEAEGIKFTITISADIAEATEGIKKYF